MSLFYSSLGTSFPNLIADVASKNQALYVPTSLTAPTYENINYNPEIREKVIKYFYYKLLERWFYKYEEFAQLLKFFKIVDNRVVLINSIDEYEKALSGKPDTDHEKSIKIKFIEDYVLEKKKIGKYLDEFAHKHNIPWIYLYRNQEDIRRYLKRKLKKKFIRTIDTKR